MVCTVLYLLICGSVVGRLGAWKTWSCWRLTYCWVALCPATPPSPDTSRSNGLTDPGDGSRAVGGGTRAATDAAAFQLRPCSPIGRRSRLDQHAQCLSPLEALLPRQPSEAVSSPAILLIFVSPPHLDNKPLLPIRAPVSISIRIDRYGRRIRSASNAPVRNCLPVAVPLAPARESPSSTALFPLRNGIARTGSETSGGVEAESNRKRIRLIKIQEQVCFNGTRTPPPQESISRAWEPTRTLRPACPPAARATAPARLFPPPRRPRPRRRSHLARARGRERRPAERPTATNTTTITRATTSQAVIPTTAQTRTTRSIFPTGLIGLRRNWTTRPARRWRCTQPRIRATLPPWLPPRRRSSRVLPAQPTVTTTTLSSGISIRISTESPVSRGASSWKQYPRQARPPLMSARAAEPARPAARTDGRGPPQASEPPQRCVCRPGRAGFPSVARCSPPADDPTCGRPAGLGVARLDVVSYRPLPPGSGWYIGGESAASTARLGTDLLFGYQRSDFTPPQLAALEVAHRRTRYEGPSGQPAPFPFFAVHFGSHVGPRGS